MNQPAMDADLAGVVAHWPRLPDAIMAGIVAMVRAAGGTYLAVKRIASRPPARDTVAMTIDAQSKPVAPKRKRRWMQFGLRTLLALVTLSAIGMALIVVPAERQRRAVQAVRDAGGHFSYADGSSHPPDLAPIQRSRFRQLPGDHYFASVVSVHLIHTKVTDAELVHLKGLNWLESLALDNAKVTDPGLVHLKGLTQLQLLYLNNTKVTDAGLVHLKGLTRLESLGLNHTKVTDAGLEHLKGLPRLEWLDLSDTQVTDAGVAELQIALPNCRIDGP